MFSGGLLMTHTKEKQNKQIADKNCLGEKNIYFARICTEAASFFFPVRKHKMETRVKQIIRVVRI